MQIFIFFFSFNKFKNGAGREYEEMINDILSYKGGLGFIIFHSSEVKKAS